MKKILFFFVAILFFLGCKNESNSSDNVSMSEAAPEAYVSSTAAVENNKDTARKFIRTADLKFKVKDAIASTYDIENITVRHGGFVTYTNLASTIDYTTSTRISKDSSLENKFYTVNNTMTLRVPNTKLDTVLKDIARNIDFLDYRIIKADDVAMDMMTNELTQRRNNDNESRVKIAIDQKGQKLNDITNAEDNIQSRQERRDEARVANMRLKDQINFSTVNLIIYQRQEFKKEMISYYSVPKEYEAGFGTKIMDALEDGWVLLESLILFLLRFWALFLLGTILFILYRRFRKGIKHK